MKREILANAQQCKDHWQDHSNWSMENQENVNEGVSSDGKGSIEYHKQIEGDPKKCDAKRWLEENIPFVFHSQLEELPSHHDKEQNKQRSQQLFIRNACIVQTTQHSNHDCLQHDGLSFGLWNLHIYTVESKNHE